MDIEKAKAAKEILDSIEKIREFRSFYEKNNIKEVAISITFQEDCMAKTATMRETNALRSGGENIQRLIRYILNGCDADIKDLESQIDRM